MKSFNWRFWLLILAIELVVVYVLTSRTRRY